MSDDSAEQAIHGRHKLPPDHHEQQPGPSRNLLRRGRAQPVFAVLAVLLCLVLGVAIATQVRQTDTGDALDSARPADLLVLLDSLRQREAALNNEVTDLQRTLAKLQATGSGDQAAIESAQARLAALSILIGTVGATGPGLTVTIDDPRPGVAPDNFLDVINELRAAGAEAMQISDDDQSVRVGVDTWIAGVPGALVIDGKTLNPPYSVVAIGDPPTLDAAMNIPGGAVDSIESAGGEMSVRQEDRVEVTVLRQPKPRQYAQPVK
ncbi:MAG TPA: DUF881 domain-containing protein [Mycobacterium sp.]|nr:DUF881 domain-containing protein [Mycobacterium sp.]